MHLWVIAKPVKVGGMGGECFPKRNVYFTGYSGRMMRMVVLRDWDAICEEGNEGVLGSEVMEEEVILRNVSLSLQFGCSGCLRGATE